MNKFQDRPSSPIPINSLARSADVVAQPWDRSPYYQRAEEFTFIFWNRDRPFRPLFDELDLTDVVELACGHGRHAAEIAGKCGHLTLVDVFKDNLEHCRERLNDPVNVSYLLGDGYRFRPLPGELVTAIYCYDAMVHFSPDLVDSYVKDAARILVPGGKALLHLSNYDAPDDRHYGLNPQARNHMTAGLLNSICAAAGLETLQSRAIDWGGVPEIDRVVLLRKPPSG